MSSMKIRQKVVSDMDRDGRLTPSNMANDAADKNHPLHDEFPWDNDVAGPLYRIEVARRIIQSVRVITTTSTQRITSVGYVRDPSLPPNVQGYISVARLQTDHDLAYSVLLQEADRIQSLVERARQFAAAVGLQDELESILLSIMHLRHAVKKKELEDA